MTAVQFETAALADTLKKAAKIAPTKGREVEQYAGVAFDISPPDPNNPEDRGEITVRATNGGVFYTEWLNFLELIDVTEPIHWRFASTLVTNIVNALPIGSGKSCTFTEDNGRIKITSGRTRASVGLISTPLAPWEGYDDSDVALVDGFGERLSQVSWAASKEDVLATSAIYMDGENIVASSHGKLVTAPLALPMDEPHVLVPMTVLAPILAQMTETKAGVLGNFLCLSPNNYTQIKCILLGDKYNDVSSLLRQETEETILFNREQAVEMVQRIMTVVPKDEQVSLDVTIGHGEVVFYTEDIIQVNTINDALTLSGQCAHDPVTYRFTPHTFLSAINRAPGIMVAMNYSPSKHSKPIRFEGQDDYRCWITPRRMA